MPNDQTLLARLISAETPSDVKRIISDVEAIGYRWVPVGDEMSNARTIDIASESSRPIVERVTNAIDAILENRHASDRSGRTVRSPREALEAWFEAPDGHISSLSETNRQKLADLIQVFMKDSGLPRRPTMIIRDFGIGQHPSDMPKTILGLGDSNKLSKHFLCGAYGQGGSTTYAWCEYSIVLSRREPSNLGAGQPDQIGWTIVKYESPADLKNNVYLYLVQPDRKFPTIDSSVAQREFRPGTHVAHVAYDLAKFSGRMTLVGYRLFNFLLFDPILPFWLIDERYKERRTIAGNLSRLKQSDQVEYAGLYDVDAGELAGMRVRYWAMKMKPREPAEKFSYYLDSYLEAERSPNTIVITLNGQVQGLMDKSFLKTNLGLSILSNYLLVQVECDNLSLPMKRRLFVSTRERVREGEDRLDLIRKEVMRILEADDEIQRLERERREQHLAASDASAEERVRRLLDRYITTAQVLEMGELGMKGGEEQEEYKPKEPPTFLKIATPGDPLEIVPGEQKAILIRSDASNDILTRLHERASLIVSFENRSGIYVARMGALRKGRLRIFVEAPVHLPPGTPDRLTCSLELSNGACLSDSRECILIAPPPPPPSSDPPTSLAIVSSDDPIVLRRGRRGVLHLESDGPDELLSRSLDPAKLVSRFTRSHGILVIGHTDLWKHRMKVFVQVPADVAVGTKDEFECVLIPTLGPQLSVRRICEVAEVPETEPGNRESRKIPNYRILPVNPGDENWNAWGWDETWVARHDKSGEILILWVSMGYDQFEADLSRRSLTPERLEGYKAKYSALIGYHLWQHYHSLRENGSAGTDEREYQDELRRAAKTILLSMRPESDLE